MTKKSILESMKELADADWIYYQDSNITNPFLDVITHEDFIEKYFSKTGKLNEIPKEFKDIFKSRAKHSNSVFFLGCMLYKHLNLDTKFKFGKEFLFIWFLTSLGHDFGYLFEKNFDIYREKIGSLNALKEHYIKFDISSGIVNNTTKHSKLYNQIKLYFEFRLKSCKLDHGIIGGLILFDALEKHREKQVEASSEGDYFAYDWSKEVRKSYARASIAIATHNIWNIDKKEQNENGIDFSDIFPLNFTEYPLLYFLGLIDTLDPVKIFEKDCEHVDKVIQEIMISFLDDECSIIISKKEGSNLDFKKIVKEVNGLIGWLNVEICHKEDYIKIKMY